SFFAPPPAPGERLACTVWSERTPDALDPALVRADMELVSASGQVWCRIDGWVDRRFDTDDVLWRVMRYPEKNLLSSRRDAGYCLCPGRWRTAASRELVARRYRDQRELAELERPGPGKKRGWLLGRMAIKVAVRDWLWRRGDGPRFPAEIAVYNEVS